MYDGHAMLPKLMPLRLREPYMTSAVNMGRSKVFELCSDSVCLTSASQCSAGASALLQTDLNGGNDVMAHMGITRGRRVWNTVSAPNRSTSLSLVTQAST